mgnify:FL=1|uniref:Uncharacterized protein n=1 Tax=viral metagenome TaxID=1070528 RepID=A0A6C0J958_9ZZZZ
MFMSLECLPTANQKKIYENWTVLQKNNKERERVIKKREELIKWLSQNSRISIKSMMYTSLLLTEYNKKC